jgi:2-polyprenyl-6-methoxyphenol hydroxylase-like FAD-dependent oxidoreductase
VTARFEDGSAASGDVLIGADGAGSRVRADPAARQAGRDRHHNREIGLNDDIRWKMPRPSLRGPTLILDPKGRFLFANGVEYGESFDN